MDDRYHRQFQLVIVHSITDSATIQSEVEIFWEARLPKAVVTTFRFIQEDVAWGTRGFVESAGRLLKEVQRDRSNTVGYLDIPTPPICPNFAIQPDLPCVILCHELGGCLVQQALVLAARDKNYYNLSIRVALIIFCNTPNSKDEELKPESYVLQLLSTSDLGSYSPLAFMKEIPPAVESLSWEYAGISTHYRSLSDKTLWTLTPGDDSTEIVSDTVNRAVGDQLRSLSQSLLEFLLVLSGVDVENHQLRLQKPIVQSKWWDTESPDFQGWKSLKESAPNILHVYNIPESSSATLASQMFFELQQTFENALLTTYALRKQDHRTQLVETFFVSLIRQILRSQPSLFRRVTSIAEQIRKEEVFSYEVLQSVLLALLRASINRPIVLILSGVQDSKTSVVESLTGLVKEYRKAPTCGFKIIILTEVDKVSDLEFDNDISSTIDTSDDEISRKLHEDFVSSRMETLVRSRSQWKQIFEATVQRLASPQSFVQAGLMASCLETRNLASTPNAMKEALQVLPSTVDEVFMMVLNHCVDKTGLCIRSLMQWILHAVRPLTVAELSVVAALSASEKPSIDVLKHDLPLDLYRDLEDLSKTLVEFAGIHVFPIYGSIGSHLVDYQGGNSHSMIVTKCLDYLESSFNCNTIRSDTSEDGKCPEAELLEYAVREWPQHYNLAPGSSIMRDRVLGFLGTEKHVQAWFKLYQKYANFSAETYYGLDDGLKVACWFGLLDVAEIAIERMKETEDSMGRLTQALDLAAANGKANVVDALLKAGASYNFGLCWASEGGFNDIVATLLDANGEAIDKDDIRGRTPFILGALRGNEKIAAYLLQKGANPSLTAGYGINALHLAALTGQVAIVQPLINAKVDVNAVTDGGDDALRLAAAGGFDNIVKLLLPYETDIDEMNKDGMTALHLAVRNGHTSVCDLLFEAGASLQKMTSQGLSSLHLAAEQGFVDVVRWLFSKKFILIDPEPAIHEVNGEGSEGDEQDDKEKQDEENDSSSQSFDTTADVLSPLQLAARNGNVEVITELLKHAEYSTEQERSTSLLLAAREGFREIVEDILNLGMVTAIRTRHGNTSLHLAAEQHPNIVSRLLKLESEGKNIFDIKAKNNYGWTPLHFAVSSGRFVTILTLLDNGSKITETTSSGQTVFHIAAFRGHSFVLQTLWNMQRGKHIEKQAISFAEDEDGNTPFTLASAQGHVGIMSFMLDKVSSSSSKVTKLEGDKKKALIMASQGGGHLEAVKLLLSNGWDVNAKDENGDCALHHAASSENIAIIKLLIANGAEPNLPGSKGWTPLHNAAAKSPDAVKALLEDERTDIEALDEEKVTPLWQASYFGQVSSVKLLLQRSPNLNVMERSRDWTPLHAAYDNPEITKLLLDAGADPTLGDANGLPLLPFVSDEANGAETVQHYLDAGLDPNIKNGDGFTAVHVAAEVNNLEIVKILKDKGADIVATGQHGETALHLSAYQGHQDVVEYLLDCGLDVNQHSTNWGTPIMAAAKGSEAQIVAVLIEKGADVNATSQDFDCYTAIQAAAWAESPDTVQTLLDGKSDVNLVGGEYGSAICASAYVGSRDIAVRLLDAGANIDYAEGPFGTAIECALSRKFWDVATLCLERNAALNLVSKGKHGTALLAAIHGENWEMVEDLLNRGADPNLKSESGETPTQAAIRKGREKILEVILDKGGKLSFRDKYGRGAISTAIVHNSLGLLQYMWGREDVDINERDAAQRTPLMLAVLQGVNSIQELHTNGAALDLQDRWGNTALIYSIIRDYQPLALELIKCGASLFKTDMRQRDALYWACRQSSSDTFSNVYQTMRKLNSAPGRFQSAINAAAASGQSSMIEALLDNIKYSQLQIYDDGWTARHTALRYRRPDLDEVIKVAIVESGQKVADPLPAVRLPTKWHDSDLSMGLFRGADPRVLKVSNTCELNLVSFYCLRRRGLMRPVVEPLKTDPPKALARTDYPMWPQKHDVYYFEITIVNQGDDDKRRFAVGFCDETTSLGVQLGWMNGSWGYHGDDGNSFRGINTGTGSPFGPTFGQGDVIGCGVNFNKQTAFYTKNGQIIGQSFTDVQGKLYPAFSVDVRMKSCEVSARFWEDDEIGNKDFMFKGPFDDPKMFHESERGSADNQADEDSESDKGSVTTGTEDSWFSNEE
jgi:ankyrin repeat protein